MSQQELKCPSLPAVEMHQLLVIRPAPFSPAHRFLVIDQRLFEREQSESVVGRHSIISQRLFCILPFREMEGQPRSEFD